MAKSKTTAPSIFNINKFLKKETLLPVYFLFGEDSYSIESAAKAIEKTVQPFLTSDFDREILNSKDHTFEQVVNSALAFPFGSEKKLVIYKDFDDKKENRTILNSYIKNPADFSILVITKQGSISNLDNEPYPAMAAKNFIFEAKELRGEELVNWVIKYCSRNDKNISTENARLILDIVGENRSLIEMQLQKMFSYLGANKEITYETIESLTSELKEYTIFELQKAIAFLQKPKAVEIAFNILDQGKEPLFIVVMLTRFFTAIAQIPELEKDGLSDQDVARKIGLHPYYYTDYKKGAAIFRGKRISSIANSLLKADVSLKTSGTDQKTVILILLTEIFNTVK